MTNDNTLRFNKPRLFRPNVVRGVIDGNSPSKRLNFEQLSTRNIESTASFRYDPPETGLKSTQQINLDWSKFENHTFFQSAEVNVNIAFHRIINEYPFDGTRKEVERFLDSLTGFEKNYIYDNFSKNIGYLFFSGTTTSPTDISGTFIQVKDFAGSEFPNFSSKITGESILDPGLGSISFEMQLFVPAETNHDSVILQKVSGSNNGISLLLTGSTSTSLGKVLFSVSSGSTLLETSASITKGQFNHVVATFNRKSSVNKLQLYVGESLKDETTGSMAFGTIDFTVSPFLIGSGVAVSSQAQGGTTFTPVATLSGALDELRVWHDIRTIDQQKSHAKKGIFQTPELKLYYKFNEPSGTLGVSADDSTNRVVIDSSGNSLHSKISESGFSFGLRNTGSINNPMTGELLEFSPVLFPLYSPTVDFNSDLLTSASRYDDLNPNIITKLIPPHYFEEGKDDSAFSTEDGSIIDAYTGQNIPGSGKLGEGQVLSEFLYVWAKFWDELKIYADAFSKLFTVDYNKNNTVPDQFLTLLARARGVDLPNLFSGADLEQFIDGDDLGVDYGSSQQTLQQIQNEVWRRILINLNDIISSKGTVHSVKSFLRTIGIDPDATFRIREFGGPTRKGIVDSREIRTEVSTMLDMSGSSTVLSSSFLSSSRVEPGYPLPQGPIIKNVNDNSYPHGLSSNSSDGLFTSGSFTYEGIYRYPLTSNLVVSTQSLMRLCTTGSDGGFGGFPSIVANVIAISGSSPQIRAYLSNAHESGSLSGSSDFRIYGNDPPGQMLEMVLTGANIFDGNLWNVSFGRFRSDDSEDFLASTPARISSNLSSSYFLRAARSDRGEIAEEYVTNEFFLESTGSFNVLQDISSNYNSKGSFLLFGSQSMNSATTGLYLNNTSIATSSIVRTTDFDGLIGHIRFWSKGLLLSEWKEHVRNFKSLGVKDPYVHFNFTTEESGSFGRLRIDASTDQSTTASNASGLINVFDFSQNGLSLSGSGFLASTNVITPQTFYFSHISPKFDEASTTNKVRVRSYQDSGLVNNDIFAGIAPLYEIEPSEEPKDDVRFSMDFSIADSLDQDIINIFSTLDSFNEAIGSPELMFEQDYPKLENYRKIYFNRLTEKVNLKLFFEFFKWFDRNIGIFIEALLPNRSKFNGVNFVVESHMLERPRFRYLFLEQYLGQEKRHSQQGTILLQQIVGGIKRF